MICRECGSQIGDDVLFCTFCGKPTKNNMNISNNEKVDSEEQQSTVETKSNNPQRSIADMFVSPDEEEIAVLGTDYLNSFIRNGSLDACYGVLTKKRFYYKGKCFYRIGNQYKTSEEERIVDLKAISGTGFTLIRSVHLYVMAIVFGLMALFCCIITFAASESGVLGIAFLLAIIAAVLAVVYDVTQKRVYEINYNGGSIAFKTDLFGKKEIREFQKVLYMTKDNLDIENENMNNK